jgi:nicotinamide-nucleotide amidase
VQSQTTDTTEAAEGPQAGPNDDDTRSELAEKIGDIAAERGITVAAAESLTGGMIASALAVAPGSSEWFRGSLVAYASEVKHDVLDVPSGPVVSAEAASTMAKNVRTLLGSDVAVAVTGAGGPGPQDGRGPGTVFLAFDDGEKHRVVRLRLEEGDPAEVCATTAAAALRMLLDALESE